MSGMYDSFLSDTQAKYSNVYLKAQLPLHTQVSLWWDCRWFMGLKFPNPVVITEKMHLCICQLRYVQENLFLLATKQADYIVLLQKMPQEKNKSKQKPAYECSQQHYSQ